MSDLYYELLVKKETTAMDRIKKYGLIFLTAVFVFGGLFISPLLLVAAIGLGVACYFIIPGTDLEFEYLFVNGELDIDKVMSKSKRKRVISLDITQADLIAPVTSHRMDYYNGNQKMKTLDYSSGNPEHRRFAMITRVGTDACRVIIEPDEKMAQSIKKSAPSKVFLD